MLLPVPAQPPRLPATIRTEGTLNPSPLAAPCPSTLHPPARYGCRWGSAPILECGVPSDFSFSFSPPYCSDANQGPLVYADIVKFSKRTSPPGERVAPITGVTLFV